MADRIRIIPHEAETGVASEAALAARDQAADHRRERAIPPDEGSRVARQSPLRY